MKTLIFPTSYFDTAHVDEDLQAEYEAVCNTHLFNIVLFEYDAWFNNDELILHGNSDNTNAIYRGWMMRPEQYEKFYQKLQKQNIQLITTPVQYNLMHEFPNVYPYIQNDTPRIMTFSKNETVDLTAVKHSFDRFIVKDYVKSAKGSDFPAYFTSDVSEKSFQNSMKLFYQYRGDLFTGGICVKEYVELAKYDNSTNEYRAFYFCSSLISLQQNSKQPTDAPRPPRELVLKYQNLASPFYTIDFAEKQDGSWAILETGDGQVSGLANTQDYQVFYEKLGEL